MAIPAGKHEGVRVESIQDAGGGALVSLRKADIGGGTVFISKGDSMYETVSSLKKNDTVTVEFQHQPTTLPKLISIKRS